MGLTGRKGRLANEAGAKAQIQADYGDSISSDPRFKPFYIVGEKILTGDEQVPEDWPIFGTIGYAFLNPLNGIFVKTSNSRVFTQIYSRFSGSKVKYIDLVYEKKRLIMLTSMSGEVNMLAQRLNEISEKHRHTRDFTLNSLRTAITEVISCFPVYRTYANHSGIKESDLVYIGQAVSEAKKRNPALSGAAFDFLERVLSLSYPEAISEADRMEWLHFTMRFQQVTGPVTAKGVEDTAFYIYNRLVSLNEVGGSPEKFGTTLDIFHRHNSETAKRGSHPLTTTSTHDTKRSEDARARLNVLSEIPDEWRRRLTKWGRLNRGRKRKIGSKTIPDRNEEYLFYQTLVAVWPLDWANPAVYRSFATRVGEYMLKTVREAKVNSSWINRDIAYEEAMSGFVSEVLSHPGSNRFLEDFIAFEDRLSYLGMFNSLSQALLKIASPGVPDFYQGCELWDLSLVDPDNRRPVDFTVRKRILKRLKDKVGSGGGDRGVLLKNLLESWHTGAVKLYLIARGLDYRKKNRLLFENGDYIPIRSAGELADHVCAFARRLEGRTVLAVAPRFVASLVRAQGEPPLGAGIWGDSRIILPDEITCTSFRNIFTNEVIEAGAEGDTHTLVLSKVFSSFPAALIEGVEGF